ncbi:MAG: glycosyltransferase family 87 protein [Gemmatimonadales bacterium]|nr:glycosyltransferase family 87 protein [Gemmatimonadales bacterium]MDZ4390636.1 glycosyltransferase family 87 protein [Gemmatimonadales bacterium]
MRPLLLSSTFWAVLIVTVGVLMHARPLRALYSADRGSNPQMSVLLSVATWVLLAGGVLNIGLRLTAGYINPRDFVQDYVAASQFLDGESMYPADVATRGAAATGENFPGREALLASPVFRGEFGRITETAPANAHPPFVGMIMAMPVAVGGLRGSYLIMAFSLLLILLLCVKAIVAELGQKPSVTSWLLIAGLLLGWHPVNAAIRSAQPGILLLGCLTAGWLSLRRSHSGKAGVWFGLAASIQAFPLLLVAYTLLRDRRAFASAVLCLTSVTVLTTVLAPDGSYSQWSETMSWIAPLFVTAPENISFTGLVMRGGELFGKQLPLTVVSLGVMATVLSWPAWHFVTKLWRGGSAESRDIEVAIVVVLMVALSPLSWTRYLPVLLLPIAVLMVTMSACMTRRGTIWLLIAAAAISVPDGTIVAGYSWLSARGWNALAYILTACIPAGMSIMVVRLALLHRPSCSSDMSVTGAQSRAV